jgi:hypothetical protein
MAWLRLSSSPATTIVINTSGVHFIAVAGYRALLSAPVGPDGLWDPSRLLHRGTGRRQARGRDLRRLGPPAPGAGQGRPVGVGRPRRVALVAPRADGRDEPLASVPTPTLEQHANARYPATRSPTSTGRSTGKSTGRSAATRYFRASIPTDFHLTLQRAGDVTWTLWHAQTRLRPLARPRSGGWAVSARGGLCLRQSE